MCGIIGYIGKREAIPVLLTGLEQLEYRGYDSAGIACIHNTRKNLYIVKEKGKLQSLKDQLKGKHVKSGAGIGHTRWATHGKPSRANAHPHTDTSRTIALIHNGIIENYQSLKKELQKKKFLFRSETDSEVAANLIASFYKTGSLEAAFRKAIQKMNGFYAFVVLSQKDPDKLIAFKRSNPLVIGIGQGENFVASDVSALLPYTKKVLYMEDDEYAVITRDQVAIYQLSNNKRIHRAPVQISWNLTQAKKGGYPHFMLKEIFEQPTVIEEALLKRVGEKDEIFFDTLTPASVQRLKKAKRIYFVSCGTAYHAGCVGAVMMEEFARMPTKSQVSSEFRYSDPIVNRDDVALFITQSGETADTIAAMREAKAKGAFTLAVVNVVGSTIAREADAVIYTHAGPEIGVASTKAYVAQLMTLTLLTLYMARLRKTISSQEFKNYLKEMKRLPLAVVKALKQSSAIEKCAKRHYHRKNFLFLGRGYNFPTALEGALKLKEISYAHAHGYAAGEMKHGPIALIDHEQPVICIAPESKTYDKMISNIEEIRARGGIVLCIGTEGDREISRLSDFFFPIPKSSELLTPILAVIPLQLFAYKIAVLNGRDVDQPRNLAKSVTVE